MTMFGSNAWDRATQHPTDLVGDNLHQGGATRHWVSPYSDPQLEYVYLVSYKRSRAKIQRTVLQKKIHS